MKSRVSEPEEEKAPRRLTAVMFSSSGKAQAPVPKIQMVLDGKDARVSYQDESALFSKKCL